MLKVFALVISGVAAATAAPVHAEAAPATPSAATLLPAITVSAIGRAVLRDRVLASGMIAAVERVLVQPRIEGQAIETLLAEVGDEVAAGQVLAQLASTTVALRKSQLLAQRESVVAGVAQAAAQVTDAEAGQAEALRVRERTLTLRQQGSVSQAMVDQIETSVVSAASRVSVARQGRVAAEAQLSLIDAQIAEAELQLGHTQITAPVDGVVVERNAVLGAIASGGAPPMFVLIRDGALELMADVAERDLRDLVAGQRAEIRLVGDAAPIAGSVRLVEPSVDLATRLGRARISLAAEGVRPGMFAEAEIIVAEREALAAPMGAVSSDADGSSVLRVGADGVVHRVPVEIGIRDGDLVEIISGLEAGDRVVSRAAAFVRDGDQINPVLASAAPAEGD